MEKLIEMYSVDINLITNEDIENAFKHSIDDTRECIKNGAGMVTDGKYLYYANGYDYPIQLRAII